MRLTAFKNKEGFTLVELLVVIAIIAILGVVAIAAINPAARINAAKDNQALANVRQIGGMLESCVADRMLSGDSDTLAVTNCCGLIPAAAGDCVSDSTHGLGLYKYGFASGYPTAVKVMRGASGTKLLCVSQQNGSNSNYTKYNIGGGNANTNTTVCNNGV